MTEIFILVVSVQADELGIESEPDYRVFRFKNSSFHGYWVTEGESVITFYVGADTFICRNTTKNINKFENILNGIRSKAKASSQ